MNYICGDRGSQYCPCHLMETGQCYTCTMISEGYCSCQSRAGWQGTCPYSEYLLQGGRISDAAQSRLTDFPVLSKTSFAQDFAVIRTAVTPGLAAQCSQPGTYMMAEALGWRTPLSVLRSRYEEKQGKLRGTLEFLVKAAGPKSRELLKMAEKTGTWTMAGPYFNGLPGSKQLKNLPKLIIARGVAAAPLIHMLDGGHLPEDCILYLDDEGLPQDFLREYLGNVPHQRVSLREEGVQTRLTQLISEKTEAAQSLLLLVSPYYAELLCRGLREVQQTLVIRPNPANLCCGMGICGSCSHTDGDGVTVKLCKCSQAVIK